MSQAGRTIALMGGGRWARVHASNLSRLLTPQDRVFWVSSHNRAQQSAIVERLPPDSPKFELLSSADEALKARPSAALIVTAPDTHFPIAESCLRQGVHAFVEKPLAFGAGEASLLIDIAAKADLILAVGVHLLSASYLRHFKSQIADRAIRQMSIRWFDPDKEVRHGESKRANDSTPLVHDVYPHIWSLVRVLTGHSALVVAAASMEPNGWVSLELMAASVEIHVAAGRSAPARERKIEIVFQSGETASFDFTRESGVAILNDVALPSDPSWGSSARPVMAEIADFLKQISLPQRASHWPHLAANCLDSVVGAEALFKRLGRSPQRRA